MRADESGTAPAGQCPRRLLRGPHRLEAPWHDAGHRDTGCLLQLTSLVGTDAGLATCPTSRPKAPLPAAFLRPYRDRPVHVANMAPGLPPAAPAVPPVIPAAQDGAHHRA